MLEVQREKPRMCADCNERITLCEQSDLLMANLARVAKAVVAVEDRRADILSHGTACTPFKGRLVPTVDDASRCRAVADAVTDLLVRLSDPRMGAASPTVAVILSGN